MKAGKLVVLVSAAFRRYHAGMNPHNLNEQPGIAWFVSRHPGAIEWAQRQNLVIDRWVAHLDPAEVQAGDRVIGTLPVNLAADICKRGARYFHLSLQVPAEWRGRELSSDDLQQLTAQIVPYCVHLFTHDLPEELS